jgi:adenylosuccinate synthase
MPTPRHNFDSNLSNKSSNVTVVVGAQWGDEGKGKWVDVLAKDSNLTVRFQGGNNAGHTLIIQNQKYVLHQIPSGIFQKNQVAALGAGVVIHPSGLLQEIKKLAPVGAITPDRLWISARAHVITPWHIHLDGQREQSQSTPIGTTKRGIGPTYSEKAARSGIRMGHYVQPSKRQAWVNNMLETDHEFAHHYYNNQPQWDEFHQAAATLEPFVMDAEQKIRMAVDQGQKVVLEGAQGTLLDLDHGTYPFVTSSSTAAAGACTSLGLPPKKISHVYGIAKAYLTRVGSGPMPTELKDDVGALIAKKGNEFGATTGRPRRCGWFDAVAMRYAASVNGFDGLIVNKIDILSGIETLKVCTYYQHPTLGRIDYFPWDVEVLEQCTPAYAAFPGWSEDVTGITEWNKLPKNAQQYLKALEEITCCPILWIGTGPGRHEMIIREIKLYPLNGG